MTKRFTFVALALAVAWLAGGFVQADDWTTHRGTPERDGTTAETFGNGLTPVHAVQVSPSNPTQIISSPVIYDNYVIVGGRDGELYRLEIDTGTVTSLATLGGVIDSSPTIHKGLAFVGTSGGFLYGVNIETGAIEFQLFHGGQQRSSVLADGDYLYVVIGVPSQEIRCYAWDDDSTPLWTTPVGGTSVSSPSLSNGVLYVALQNGQLVAVNASDGTMAWSSSRQTLGSFQMAVPAVGAGGLAGTPGESDNQLYFVDLADGSVDLLPPARPAFNNVAAKASYKAGVTGGAVTDDGESVALDTATQSALDLWGMLSTMEQTIYQESEGDRANLREAFGQKYEVDFSDLDRALAWMEQETSKPAASAKATSGGSGPSYAPAWSADFDMVVPSGAAIENGVIYITQRETGSSVYRYNTFAVNSNDGSTIWSTPDLVTNTGEYPYLVSSPVVTDEWVVVARHNQVEVRQKATGTLVQTIDNSGSDAAVVASSPAAGNTYVAWASMSGTIYVYKGENERPTPPNAVAISNGSNVLDYTPTISWSGADDADAADNESTMTVHFQVSYDPVVSDGNAHFNQFLAQGTTSWTPATPYGDHTHLYYRMRVQDSAGAWSEWSDVYDFWVHRDLVPPAEVGNLAAVEGNAEVDLSWQNPGDADFAGVQLEVKESTDVWGNATTSDLGNVTSHTATGLTNYTTYDFRIKSYDDKGNYSAGETVSSTPEPPDVTAPADPGNLVVTELHRRLRATWDPVADVDLDHFKVYIKLSTDSWSGVTGLDVGVNVSHDFASLTNGSSYDIKVTSVDTSANESLGSEGSGTPNPPVTIGGDPNNGFDTIQDAIDAAQNGDTIHLNAGTYDENIVVPPGINIKGIPGRTVMRGDGSGPVIRIQSGGSKATDVSGLVTDTTIEGLVVTSGTAGIDTANGQVLVLNCILTGNSEDGLVTGSDGTLIASNNTVYTNGRHGFFVNTAEALIKNCIVMDNGTNGVMGRTTTVVRYSNCAGNNGDDIVGPFAQNVQGCTKEDVEFEDVGNMDYAVKSGAPTIDGGDPDDDYATEPMPNGGRVNMGAFGNTVYATKSGGGGGISLTGGSSSSSSTCLMTSTGNTATAFLLLLLAGLGLMSLRPARQTVSVKSRD